MQEFQELQDIIDRLLGPGGCPWDQKQTLQSMRSSIVEEVFEFIEAIDLEDNHHILEELGDLFFNVIFLAKLAEKEKRCTLKNVLTEVNHKLIRRHPHVFGQGEKIESLEKLYEQWDQIKAKEQGKEKRKSVLDGIPKELPVLSRTQKILKQMKKLEYVLPEDNTNSFETEAELGIKLLNIIAQANEKGLDSEHALRKTVALLEKDLLEKEKKSS